MTLATYLLGVVSALVAIAVIVEMLRRRRLRERHAIWWLIAGLLALIISVFPSTLTWAAALLGVTVPVNLVFFVTLVLLSLVCLQASAELTTLEAKTRTLAESTALLRMRVEELERATATAADPLARPRGERGRS
jgi:hypothetical protein